MDTPIPTPTETYANIRASDVSGTNVYNSDGEHLGHIDDIILSKAEGKADVAIMSFGGFLGIGERYHPLPWKTLRFDPAMNGYVVNLTREQLDNAPTYDAHTEPDWNNRAYNASLYGYYGF